MKKLFLFVAAALALAGGGLWWVNTSRASPSSQSVPPVSAAPAEEVLDQAKDPMHYLEHFYRGQVSKLPSGRTLREYKLVAMDVEIEVAPGVKFPAWTYNGTVPGPTIRCTEGDRLKLVLENRGTKPHTIHLHGIHPANMDGVFEVVPIGSSFTYEFDAEPFGVFPYHCHVEPITKHIERGLYGALIIDPKVGRPKAHELVMVMNGFDTDMDGENDIYTVNGVANYYKKHPIPLKLGELVRVYLINMLERDMINSFHLHANMFQHYPSGTSLTPRDVTDTVIQGQGERAVLEFRYKFPGRYLFHAHKTEFAELGWLGVFDVQK